MDKSSELDSRWILALLALGYLVFVVYGSLVPLRYTPLPWDQAVARFEAIPFLQLGIGSRADWVANLLLFIPLSFLGLGALWPRRTLARLAVSLLVLSAALGLALGIEFTQIFYPPAPSLRTTSWRSPSGPSSGSGSGGGGARPSGPGCHTGGRRVG